jgi:hypothetical protein
MNNCVYCFTIFDEDCLYCSECSNQIKCKNCNVLLKADAKGCVRCGVRLGEGSNIPESTITNNGSANTLNLKETRNSRSIEVKFTDHAIEQISDALGHILIDRLGNKSTQTNGKINSKNLLSGAIENNIEKEDEFVDGEIESEDNSHSDSGKIDSDQQKLHQIFYYKDNQLVLDNYNLKAKTQLDAARRAVFLFLYAHNLEGRKLISREDINAMLKDIGLLDPNVSNWISTTPDLAQENDGDKPMFRLRINGQNEAVKILGEVLDPNIKEEWTISDRRKAKSKTTTIASETSDKTGSKSPKKPTKKNEKIDGWVSKWNALKLGVDGHTIVKDAKMVDGGIFSLWAIRKATNNEVQIVGGSNLVDFIYKAFVVQIDRRNLTRALEVNGKGKVLRVSDGYELNPTGVTHAEQLSKSINGSAPKSKTEKK